MSENKEYGPEKVSISYAEIGLMERHILSLQGYCRLASSFWLWGCFAGMAYVMTENLNLHIGNELIFLGINTIALLGICMLWALDLQVYHRQLVWLISEGRYLESKYVWLPNLRKYRYSLLCHSDSSPRMVWYYLLQVLILMCLGATSLGYWLNKKHPDSMAGYTSMYVIIVSMIILLFYIVTDDKVPTNPKSQKKNQSQ